jgi:hypothetical protein
MNPLSLSSFSALAAGALLAGCIYVSGSCDGGPAVEGSGHAGSESRSLSDFHRVEIRGSVDVVAHVGGAQTVRVEADDNLIPHITTVVRDGTLVVAMESGSYRFHKHPQVTVDLPLLDSASISGSADIEASGLRGPAFKATISGSGNVRGSGEVDRLEVAIEGSGNVRLYDLRARSASINIEGSGNVQLYAAENLSIKIDGSGDVRYRGEPKLTQSIDGSGGIKHD